jgi:uncharacterized membrane protein
MTFAVLSWLVALPLLGVLTGLRTMTPIAVLCWFAWRGHLPLDGTWAVWTTRLATPIVFTVLAIAEMIGDKLPRTPNRTALGPLAARVVVGGLVGALVATGLDGDLVEGIFLSVTGALLGSYGGYLVRRELVQRLDCKDWHIAAVEDMIAVVCSILAMGVITG